MVPHHLALRAAGSAILVADLVLLHATLIRGIYDLWGMTRASHVLAASAIGMAASTLFLRDTETRPAAAIVSILASGLCWAVAGLLTDWAFADGISAQPIMPQWWLVIHPGPGCASGIAFLGGQGVAGAAAGLGLAIPTLFERQSAFAWRALWSLGSVMSAAVTWAAAFHGRWVT